jgi:hypothetical protein
MRNSFRKDAAGLLAGSMIATVPVNGVALVPIATNHGSGTTRHHVCLSVLDDIGSGTA